MLIIFILIVYNFAITDETSDQATIKDTPKMSQDFPHVLNPYGRLAGAQVCHKLYETNLM